MKKSVFRRMTACLVALVMLACMLPTSAMALNSANFDLDGGSCDVTLELTRHDNGDDSPDSYTIPTAVPTKQAHVYYITLNGVNFADNPVPLSFQYWYSDDIDGKTRFDPGDTFTEPDEDDISFKAIYRSDNHEVIGGSIESIGLQLRLFAHDGALAAP